MRIANGMQSGRSFFSVTAKVRDAPEDVLLLVRDIGSSTKLFAGFGERMAEIVRECSDSMSADAGDKGADASGRNPVRCSHGQQG